MTFAEENYLKIIYHLVAKNTTDISTNAIAEQAKTKASSVTDMLKKLAEKKLILYKKYQGVSLTEMGLYTAKMIVRKHRLWEVFLVDTLDFSWDEVHDIAEQLEHIQSDKLINKLDKFLNFPTHDPHGDPIPNESGEIFITPNLLLAELEINEKGICTGVKDSSPEFLQYLSKQGIALGTTIQIIAREPFDGSLYVKTNTTNLLISSKIANNLYIKKV